MGIKDLLKFLKPRSQEVTLDENYSGSKIGVDASCWIHRAACSCAYELICGLDTDKFIKFFLDMVQLLTHFKIIPYIVFDGRDLPAKSDESEKRSKTRNEARDKVLQARATYGDKYCKMDDKIQKLSQQGVKITTEMTERIIASLKEVTRTNTLNVNYLIAPFESDAQLAYMCRTGFLDYVISEDSDLLCYGCPALISKMDKYGTGVLYQIGRCVGPNALLITDSHSDQKLLLPGTAAGAVQTTPQAKALAVAKRRAKKGKGKGGLALFNPADLGNLNSSKSSSSSIDSSTTSSTTATSSSSKPTTVTAQHSTNSNFMGNLFGGLSHGFVGFQGEKDFSGVNALPFVIGIDDEEQEQTKAQQQQQQLSPEEQANLDATNRQKQEEAKQRKEKRDEELRERTKQEVEMIFKVLEEEQIVERCCAGEQLEEIKSSVNEKIKSLQANFIRKTNNMENVMINMLDDEVQVQQDRGEKGDGENDDDEDDGEGDNEDKWNDPDYEAEEDSDDDNDVDHVDLATSKLNGSGSSVAQKLKVISIDSQGIQKLPQLFDTQQTSNIRPQIQDDEVVILSDSEDEPVSNKVPSNSANSKSNSVNKTQIQQEIPNKILSDSSSSSINNVPFVSINTTIEDDDTQRPTCASVPSLEFFELLQTERQPTKSLKGSKGSRGISTTKDCDLGPGIDGQDILTKSNKAQEVLKKTDETKNKLNNDVIEDSSSLEVINQNAEAEAKANATEPKPKAKSKSKATRKAKAKPQPKKDQKKPKKVAKVKELSKVPAINLDLNLMRDWSFDMFRIFCILCGCDYNVNWKVKGLGSQSVFKIVQSYRNRSLDYILLKFDLPCDSQKLIQIYNGAMCVFRHHVVYNTRSGEPRYFSDAIGNRGILYKPSYHLRNVTTSSSESESLSQFPYNDPFLNAIPYGVDRNQVCGDLKKMNPDTISRLCRGELRPRDLSVRPQVILTVKEKSAIEYAKRRRAHDLKVGTEQAQLRMAAQNEKEAAEKAQNEMDQEIIGDAGNYFGQQLFGQQQLPFQQTNYNANRSSGSSSGHVIPKINEEVSTANAASVTTVQNQIQNQNQMKLQRTPPTRNYDNTNGLNDSDDEDSEIAELRREYRAERAQQIQEEEQISLIRSFSQPVSSQPVSVEEHDNNENDQIQIESNFKTTTTTTTSTSCAGGGGHGDKVESGTNNNTIGGGNNNAISWANFNRNPPGPSFMRTLPSSVSTKTVSNSGVNTVASSSNPFASKRRRLGN